MTTRLHGMQARMTALDDMDASLHAEWADLEQRALEGNAFLSPCFVLPAAKFLTPGHRPLAIVIETRAPGRATTLHGIGLFQLCRGTRGFPLPHLSVYSCPHSYTSGLLVDATHSSEVIDTLLEFLISPNAPWHAVRFCDLPADGNLAQLLNMRAESSRLRWHEFDRYARAVLNLRTDDDPYAAVPAHLKKEIGRCDRRLAEQGDINYRLRRGAEVDAECIENFLRLENLGWKAASGSSLLARPGHAEFFREMISCFARQDRAFFMELSLDRRVIASTSNLISGTRGFAFKIGWDPAYAKMSPGILNEFAFLALGDGLDRLQCLDSGTTQGSFIERLWPGRQTMVSGFYTTTSLGKLTLTMFERLRRVKRIVTRLRDMFTHAGQR